MRSRDIDGDKRAREKAEQEAQMEARLNAHMRQMSKKRKVHMEEEEEDLENYKVIGEDIDYDQVFFLFIFSLYEFTIFYCTSE